MRAKAELEKKEFRDRDEVPLKLVGPALPSYQALKPAWSF